VQRHLVWVVAVVLGSRDVDAGERFVKTLGATFEADVVRRVDAWGLGPVDFILLDTSIDQMVLRRGSLLRHKFIDAMLKRHRPDRTRPGSKVKPLVVAICRR
jgi:hypothetical protein